MIAILAGIAVLILTPIEINKIKNGWVRKNFKGSQEDFLKAYRKQLTVLIVVGLICAAFNIAMGFLSEVPNDNYVKFFAGALWIAVAGTSYWGRGQLDNVQPAPAPPASNTGG